MTVCKSDFRWSLGRYPKEAFALIDDVFRFQQDSYQKFLEGNDINSLEKIVSSFFPIKDLFGNFEIEFVSISMGKPSVSINDCIRLGGSYCSSAMVRLRTKTYIENGDGGKILASVNDQDVALFDIPLIGEDGKFVMNGVERVVISQIHRSPGLVFSNDKDGNISRYRASLIPYNGTWIDFEIQDTEGAYVILDKKRKIDLVTFLYAIGFDSKTIVSKFYDKVEISVVSKADRLVKIHVDTNDIKGMRFPYCIYSESGEIVVKEGLVLTAKRVDDVSKSGFICKIDDIKSSLFLFSDLEQIGVKAGSCVDADTLISIKEEGMDVGIVNFIKKGFSDIILKSIISAVETDNDSAAALVLKMIRKGEMMATSSNDSPVETVRSFLFDGSRCNLSAIGRYKLNATLGTKSESLALTDEDCFLILKALINLKENPHEIEDIDHLGNRRIRTASELIGNMIISSMRNLVKVAIDKMSNSQSGMFISAASILLPNQISKTIKDFMLTSQLSQLMEQTNPLSELSHKRRISALGPGGVERDRVGIEVRDVHPTHYGRICIVETPDSQNIGLISNLACFAKINKYGFIETPYKVVKDRKILDEIVYLDASSEQKYSIASYNTKYVQGKEITDDIVSVRRGGEFVNIQSDKVDFIDMAPNQPLSQTASLIPFCEANDSYRVLMSSNMHRQSVPVIKADAPIIATGFEKFVGMKSSAVVKSEVSGTVCYVDSRKIYIKDEEKSDIHCHILEKFKRTNNSTCANFNPCVKLGDVIKIGQPIADTFASEVSEIALGQNVKVAFMSWNGYGFEDSVIVSERVVADERFSSIHIEEFTVTVMDTRLGSEQITRSIPSVSESAVANLDEAGIVKIGTFVKPGDILVGKISPKAESPMTPEEKLLRAIFGEGKTDVKNTSLTLSPGYSGVVVDVQVFSRRGVEKIGTQVENEVRKVHSIKSDLADKIEILRENIIVDILKSFTNAAISKSCKLSAIPISRKLEKAWLEKIAIKDMLKIVLDDVNTSDTLHELVREYLVIVKRFEDEAKLLISNVKEEKDFSNGILYEVKVFVATKSNLQPGDKVAGRHGNKGIISKIVPTQDMPFMKDGTPIDVIVNPLGIVARMNLGQVLELSLGLVSMTLGKKISKALEQYTKAEDVKKAIIEIIPDKYIQDKVKSLKNEEVKEVAKMYAKGVPFNIPVFSGINYKTVQDTLKMVGCDESGQVDLYDGMTGDKFERKVSVGILYILKLHHMVDKKVHARSVGPYSLITQQPLGGKTNFGGQRLGEMECWAVEAYGAAYTLNEMLTVKSDDVRGRKSMYSAIVSGTCDYKKGMPESFNVLLKELSALGLNVSLMDESVI